MSETYDPAEPVVFSTTNSDGSAEFTISVDDEDHKFSVSVGDDGTARLSYEETLSWRGQIRVSKPRESVYKQLIQSDEMTEYLDSRGLESVQRE